MHSRLTLKHPFRTYINLVIPRIFVTICNPRILGTITLRPQLLISAFSKGISRSLHSAIMSWSIELADAFLKLHDLFASRLYATSDEERQDLDNQIDLQKAHVKTNEGPQQEIMRDAEPDSPEERVPRSLAALWSSLVIATVNWKDPSAEERKNAMSELDILWYIFRRLEHRARFI